MITNCNIDGSSTSTIAQDARRIESAAFIVSSFSHSMIEANNDGTFQHRNSAELENRESRFGKMLSRSKLTGLFDNVENEMPRIGDVRFVVEHIDGDRFEKLARKRGWKDGEDGMLDYAEHIEAAIYSEHKTLDEAKAAANAFLANGNSLFGCCQIDRQVFERFEDGMYPDWERHETYEVAMDGELIEVAS